MWCVGCEEGPAPIRYGRWPLGCHETSVVGSLLPNCQKDTCLVYCQAANWHLGEGGFAEDGRRVVRPTRL